MGMLGVKTVDLFDKCFAPSRTRQAEELGQPSARLDHFDAGFAQMRWRRRTTSAIAFNGCLHPDPEKNSYRR